MTYKFEKDPINGLILFYIVLDEMYEFKLMLDTGASNTTFDVNALHMASYPIGNTTEAGMVETANGIVEVGIIETDVISAFGHIVRNMKVQTYDFLAHGILSDYEGVLGLDFFENTAFRIDMKNQTIEVEVLKSVGLNTSNPQ